jgi:septal ring-binding cell division protein DamX
MASGGKRGAGERVLEGRHVIGLFMLMLLFSGVFFTLGYVMGRNQYDGQASASTASHSAFDAVLPKPNTNAKRPEKMSTPPAHPQPTDTAPPNSDWEFYNSGKSNASNDHLKPVDPAATRKAVPAVAKTDSSPNAMPASAKSASSPKSAATAAPSAGNYTLQVAALTKEADAFDLASRLQKKKFPAVVLSPQGDKFYRVQVGPYADQKSADAAKKGLEAVGFKAFVKH